MVNIIAVRGPRALENRYVGYIGYSNRALSQYRALPGQYSYAWSSENYCKNFAGLLEQRPKEIDRSEFICSR